MMIYSIYTHTYVYGLAAFYFSDLFFYFLIYEELPLKIMMKTIPHTLLHKHIIKTVIYQLLSCQFGVVIIHMDVDVYACILDFCFSSGLSLLVS